MIYILHHNKKYKPSFQNFNMDKLKQAFLKIKNDISELQEQIHQLKQEISHYKVPTNQDITLTSQNITPTTPTQTPTMHPLQTDTPTQTPTHQQSVQPISPPNLAVSIGNGGVPTDKPTDRQTNQQTDNNAEKFAQPHKNDMINEFQQAQQALDSLDNIKKGIRLKFKRLTPQEMRVFSALYTFEEQNIEEITYKLLANNLNLSESSIRDYTNKLISKGVPIIKTRQNNKKIALSISQDLKNIATLSTINKLRDL